MRNSAPYVSICLVLYVSLLALSAAVIGLGYQKRVSKINPLFYFFIGIPLGLYLVFRLKMYESGFWIGIACSYLLISIFFIVIYRRTDYEKIVRDIRQRYNYQPIKEDMEDTSKKPGKEHA